jgi:transposase-like protein
MKCSHKFVKAGIRYNKSGKRQILKCVKCKIRKSQGDFLRHRFKKEIIINAVKYYKKGNSLQDTKDYLHDKYNVKVSRFGISKWIRKLDKLTL